MPLLTLFALYIAVGAMFSATFLTRGIRAIDPAAKGATLGFRLIILPGVIALWPVLLHRWIAGSPQQD